MTLTGKQDGRASDHPGERRAAQYLPAQTVTNPAAIGGATNVLGDATTTLVDRGNTVNIVLTQGTLQSDTEQNVFAGKNAAALGAEGRWEIHPVADGDFGDRRELYPEQPSARSQGHGAERRPP